MERLEIRRNLICLEMHGMPTIRADDVLHDAANETIFFLLLPFVNRRPKKNKNESQFMQKRLIYCLLCITIIIGDAIIL